jgi:hypothetical protein
MAMEQFIGRKAKKFWAMKVGKTSAGASIKNPQGGRAGDAKAISKQPKAAEPAKPRK